MVGNAAAAISLSAWVQSTDASGNVLSADTGNFWTNSQYDIAFNTTAACRIWTVGGTPPGSGNGPALDGMSIDVNDGNWHNIIVTYDGTTMAMYVDGALVGTDGTVSGPLNDSGGHLTTHMGTNGDASYGGLNGNVKKVRIWNRALSTADVAAVAGGY